MAAATCRPCDVQLQQRRFIRGDRRFVISAIGLVVMHPLVRRALKGRDPAAAGRLTRSCVRRATGQAARETTMKPPQFATKGKNSIECPEWRSVRNKGSSGR